MRTWRMALGVIALTVLLTGCWPFPGAGPDRRSQNPFERDLTPATVGNLTEAFRQPLADGSGPPVVSRDGLFVRSGVQVVAFETGTGASRWSVELTPDNDGFNYISDPYILEERDQVLASASTYGGAATHGDVLVRLDAATGAEEDRRNAEVGIGSVRGNDAGLVGTDSPDGFHDTWIGIHPVDGGQRWGGIGGFLSPPPVVTLGPDQLFAAAVPASAVWAYDTTVPCTPYEPGETILVCAPQWTRPVDGAPTPVVIGDDATVHAGSTNGRLYALRSDTGDVRWTANLGSPVREAPALADGTLFVATADGRLGAVPAGGCGAAECTPTWTTAAGSEITVQPAVAGGVVYVGSADGTLKAFAATGCGAPICPPLWTADTGTSPVSGGLAVYSGRLYVGTGDALIAYGVPRG